MKRKLLVLTLMASLGLSAQTNHVIPWFMGVPSSQTNISIAPGDSVTWDWNDTAPHTVTSQSGSSETFDSGVLTGSNQQYTHTFSNEGSNPYKCNIHSSMNGVITVQETMSLNDVNRKSFKAYPNPVQDVFTITSQETINTVKVYDISGRLILDVNAGTPEVKLYMNAFNAGTYIVQAAGATSTQNITVVKK